MENAPKELYEALRERARSLRRSIAAEVLALFEEKIPAEKELRARRTLFCKLKELSATKLSSRDSCPAAEEMQREDRTR